MSDEADAARMVGNYVRLVAHNLAIDEGKASWTGEIKSATGYTYAVRIEVLERPETPPLSLKI